LRYRPQVKAAEEHVRLFMAVVAMDAATVLRITERGYAEFDWDSRSG
jgi:hypothetical protein